VDVGGDSMGVCWGVEGNFDLMLSWISWLGDGPYKCEIK
jgi:hypothetical protein